MKITVVKKATVKTSSSAWCGWAVDDIQLVKR